MFAKEEQGKTPKEMAEELKGYAPYAAALVEAGYREDGMPIIPKTTEVSRCHSDHMCLL